VTRAGLVAHVLISLILLGIGRTVRADPSAAPAIVPPQVRSYVQPPYPPQLLKDGMRGTVVLELDVDVDGNVNKATVAESAGPDFDAAALAAGRQLRFDPATQGGKPVPVRLKFRYAFKPDDADDRRGMAPSLGRYDRRGFESPPQGPSSLAGRVLEKGTARPVPGALVTIPALREEAIADADGHFRFGNLRPGTHEVYLPATTHEALRVAVTITADQTAQLVLRPQRSGFSLYRATAESPPEPGEMARRSLGVEQIQRIPGVQGDAFKVVQNLPGVARPTAISGLLVVRGSAPQDTFVSVEGVHVPLLYHFGGVYSILNTDLLDAIDFYPGGYPVRHGRQTGGIVTARLASPKLDEPWRGYVESNVFHTGFLVQGPLGKDTHLAFAARRSYVDLVLDFVLDTFELRKYVPFTLAPRYYDGQLKLDHRLGPRTDATAMVFMTDDALTALVPDPPAAFPDARGEVSSRQNFWTLLGILRHRGVGKGKAAWTSTTTLGALIAGSDVSLFDVARARLRAREYTLRQEFTWGDGPLQMRAGLDVLGLPYEIEIYAPALRSTGERGQGQQAPTSADFLYVQQENWLLSPSLWFDAVYRLHPRWEVVPGVRVDLYRGASGGEHLGPRLNVRHNWREHLTLKAAAGASSQRPQPYEVADRFGNPDLVPARTWELAFGLEWRHSDAIDLDVQVFRKELRDLTAVPEGIVPRPPFVNSATGHVTGLELLLRHKPVGRFFGWIAYTLQRAVRQDRPGAPERLFGWDQTHILTMLGSYKLKNDWELGARFRLVTGNPITERATSVWNEQTDTWTPVRSDCTNCGRLPTFHQLDLRVDKKWTFERWLLNAYLDVQNAYNWPNAEGVRYNFDGSQHTYRTGLPIIPSLGLRAEF
jgi:TonB family protein